MTRETRHQPNYTILQEIKGNLKCRLTGCVFMADQPHMAVATFFVALIRRFHASAVASLGLLFSMPFLS